MSAAMGFFAWDSKKALVNEPSVLEPLKFYCTKMSTRCSFLLRALKVFVLSSHHLILDESGDLGSSALAQ